MRKLKKLLLGIATIAVMAVLCAVCAGAETVNEYTYTITPLLAPFNEYFFVKTDNPDPTSFRFADKSSIYSEDSYISLDSKYSYGKANLYEDICYEDEQTGRVNGGYIFKSFTTDGGEIVLQLKTEGQYSWEITWSDTSVILTLPELKDDVDYLIDTYATKSDFFDNMDAVEEGLSSICLYSGSYILGDLYRAQEYWALSTSPHIDQRFYIQSPYSRKDNKQLFASVIYPYLNDSLSYPGLLATVAGRLDSSSSYVWNSDYHWLVDITYGGETRSYGGSGYIKGQGISEDKIQQYFTFGTDGTKITLDSVRQLLTDYSSVEMEDDVPREDALTLKSVYDKVGNGAWARLIGIKSIYGATSSAFSYFYQKGDGECLYTSSVGSNGTQMYMNGDLGYASDTWVDGRYVDSWETFIPGEKFEDHPTSSILLSNVAIPQITYSYTNIYNYETSKLECKYYNIEITEKEKTVLFCYSQDEDLWIANYDAFDTGCATYSLIVSFVEQGLIDEHYLDMVTLTQDEVKALGVDKNTDTIPDDYYIYDRSTEPGTSLKEHTHKYTSEITQEPTCSVAGVRTYTCSVCGGSYTEAIAKTAHTYVTSVVKPTLEAEGYTLHKCSVCGYSYKDNYTDKLLPPSKVTGLTYGARSADYVSLRWDKDDNASGYIVEYLSGDRFVKLVDKTNGSAVSHKVTGLEAGTLYKFRVRAYKNVSGKRVYAAYSEVLRVRTLPTAMTGLTLGARTDTSITLKWDKNESANGAVVEMYDGTNWVVVATKTSNSAVSHKITGLKASTAYKFRVRAYINDEEGRIYSVYNVTLNEATAPSAVKNFRTVMATKTALRFNWDKNTTADGYCIEMVQDGKWVQVTKIESNATIAYAQLKLNPATTYRFRIRAYKQILGKTIYGAYATISATTAS